MCSFHLITNPNQKWPLSHRVCSGSDLQPGKVMEGEWRLETEAEIISSPQLLVEQSEASPLDFSGPQFPDL